MSPCVLFDAIHFADFFVRHDCNFINAVAHFSGQALISNSAMYCNHVLVDAGDFAVLYVIGK